MKPLFYTALIALTSLCNNTSAQQFIKGNCKPDHYLPPCTQSLQDSVNKNMGNCWINRGPEELFIGDASCGGDATHPYFIGIEYATGPGLGGVNVIFKLDKPMVANTKYKFSFDYRTDGTNDGAFPIWYYNNNNDSVGRDSFFIANMPPSGTTWTTVVDSVTPKINCQFISLNAGVATSGAYSQTYIANLKMLGVPGVSVEEVNMNIQVQVYPNPMHNSAKIIADASMHPPFNLSATDIHGKTVLVQNGIQQQEFTINKNDLPTGMYFLKIIDSNKNNSYTKLVIE